MRAEHLLVLRIWQQAEEVFRQVTWRLKYVLSPKKHVLGNCWTLTLHATWNTNGKLWRPGGRTRVAKHWTNDFTISLEKRIWATECSQSANGLKTVKLKCHLILLVVPKRNSTDSPMGRSGFPMKKKTKNRMFWLPIVPLCSPVQFFSESVIPIVF